MYNYLNTSDITHFIQQALLEDVGTGDHTSLSSIPQNTRNKAKLLVKDEGILAGVELAKHIFHVVDPSLEVNYHMKDGQKMKHGDIVLQVNGSVHAILKAERLVLNSMQRMSAIATKTNSYVKLLIGTNTKILDTRKTTPGFRACEKWAVKIGGGENHRFALYDMIMLKDNHNDFAGGITSAIAKTKQYLKDNNIDLKIIVEARNLNEIKEILKSDGIYRILIDNFNLEDTKTAVTLIGNKCLTESSGNINENTIADYAKCGVNYISSGALTHSVCNMDLSLKAF